MDDIKDGNGRMAVLNKLIAARPPPRVMVRRGDEIAPKAVNWLLRDWLPAGKLIILAGVAGTGKTTLSLDFAAVVSSGGTWPDGSTCKSPGNVLIWSGEDDPDDTLVPRLIAAGADLSRIFFISGMADNGKTRPFDPSSDIDALNRLADEIGGVSLLIIDPIVSAVDGDMHKANDVRRSLQAVVDFAGQFDCAVIGITHFTKNSNGKSPLDRVNGSQAFGALARMVLVAAKEEGSDRRVLARAKSNIAPDDGGFTYSLDIVALGSGIETTRIRWQGAIDGTAREILSGVELDDDAESGDDLSRLLIDLLSEHGGKMSAKQIRGEITDAGFSWSKANRAKAKLGIESGKEKGNLTGSWFWYLPKELRKNREGIGGKKTESSEPSISSGMFSQTDKGEQQ